ncbi:hypothetical protein AGMMS50256_31990 [Betaproteobacteria bacterium]|nr:hypothetical protein AGMMS50256_31990 [Betaproteobacteria bacterium]
MVSDILNEVGYSNQVVPDELKPLDVSRKLAGQVLTVRDEQRVTVANPGSTITRHEVDMAIQQGTVI